LQPEAGESRPVERPALFVERLQAAAVDVALLSGLWSVVVYFASRAARVPLSGLLPSWPWLTGYLAFLGLVYAAYFTGTTGQTLGKILLSLRVVDTAGQPPGYLRALLRAALGAVSVLAAGLGLVPMAFDPARRALHDRAFRTRVIRG
ncbi:MAG TPA: RDD family protein, partial [Vicinamibacteria bacterium]|nr:RDD family protein [Vicinamibacteria bacterium]